MKQQIELALKFDAITHESWSWNWKNVEFAETKGCDVLSYAEMVHDQVQEMQGWSRFAQLPSDQVKELDVWIRREGVEYVSDAEITLRGTSELAPQFRNLLRLCQAGRSLSPTVKLNVTSESENSKLYCKFESNENGVE